jgi:DtxR family Mn-dependent transcriptional regulator
MNVTPTPSAAAEPPLSKAQEDYLETLLQLAPPPSDGVMLSELAAALRVKPASASEMINRLRELGLVTRAPRERIQLTEQGAALAQTILDRHAMLRRFFTEVLHVSPGVADADACAAEHLLHQETYTRIRDFLDHVKDDALEHDHTVPLTLLRKGSHGVLRRISGGHGKQTRLTAMGVNIGAELTVLQNSGVGPVMVKLGNARVAIGRGLATTLHIAISAPTTSNNA